MFGRKRRKSPKSDPEPIKELASVPEPTIVEFVGPPEAKDLILQILREGHYSNSIMDFLGEPPAIESSSSSALPVVGMDEPDVEHGTDADVFTMELVTIDTGSFHATAINMNDMPGEQVLDVMLAPMGIQMFRMVAMLKLAVNGPDKASAIEALSFAELIRVVEQWVNKSDPKIPYLGTGSM